MTRKPFLMAIWSTHRLLLLGLAALLGLNLLLFVLLYFGVAPQLSAKERDLSLLQQELRSSDPAAPQQNYAQGEKEYERFRTLLPALGNFSDLLGELYSLAHDCNLEISQIAYAQKELPEVDIISYDLKFSLTGTYDELKHFIYGLEELRRLIVIEQINLTASKREEGMNLVSLNLNLKTYFGTEGKE